MGAGATLLCCWLAGMEKGSILLSCAGLLVALLSAIGTLVAPHIEEDIERFDFDWGSILNGEIGSC